MHARNEGSRKRPLPRTYVRPTVTPYVVHTARGFVPLAAGGRKRSIKGSE